LKAKISFGLPMAKDRLSGKLTVILHADVAGSTELVQQDKELAHKRIRDTFRRFRDTIEKYQGHVLELRGDALLAEFEHASDAVSAALSFQINNAGYNSKINDDLRPTIRVGIAVGEVVIADDTVTGAGVVQAQRVEQLAAPGGVCITAAIQEDIPKRMPVDLENLGEKSLKGFEYPVRVFRVELRFGESIPSPETRAQSDKQQILWKKIAVMAVAVLVIIGGIIYSVQDDTRQIETASLERMAFPLPDKPSIAILPFTNMSGDAEQEYFVDGMTEDLITDISKVSGLFVIARNSVFTYKGKAVKVRQVAEELGVRYVLEGSVRRSGDQVRINAQLIDATTGGHLWADRYDGSMADVFALQDTVTRQIVNALQLKLVQGETTTSRTVNTAAYDSFLKGWAHYQRRTVNDLKQAVPYLEQAIQLDEKYVQAHAALAAVYWETLQNNWAEDLGISREDATTYAKAHLAQAMKEPSSLAHWVASNLLIAEGNYEDAVIEARKIVSLDSNNADGYATLANALALSGKADESTKLVEKAVRRNPRSSLLHAAVQKNDVETIRRLMADGFNVNAKDYFGSTSLHIASYTGNAEIVALLIDSGADIEARARGYPDNRFLFATPLMVASQRGHLSVAELLISAGADANTKNTTVEGGSTRTAIHWAAFDGYTDIAKLLIANGADIEAVCCSGLWTPLSIASMKGHGTMSELLISKGANVNYADFNAKTPLHNAAISGNVELVQLLLANGADVGAKTIHGSSPGETPLHVAVISGHEEIAGLLLANGADVNAVDQHNYTPLRRAVDGGYLAIAKLLIKKGADIATKDASGVTPLHIIARTDNIEIAELLIGAGADVNAQDSNSGFTPLDYAQDGDERMIEILEKHGAICTSC
jgi:TolB-like protein/ankyrin repeat protein/class 3 adenylate cyclase